MYGKIFGLMYEGSMVGAGPVVFAVWGYCIAKADTDGTILLNPSLLAPIIGTSRTEIEAAISFLTQPDAHSKNPEHEGRRLLHQTGFLYLMVSFAVYRRIKNGEDRREYMREYMKRKREKELLTVNKVNGELTKVNSASSSTSTSSQEGGCKGGCDAAQSKPNKKGADIPDCLSSVPGFSEAFAAWVEFRAAKRAKATDRVKATILKRLAERPGQAVAALDTCMAAGWTDVKWDWIDNRNKAQPPKIPFADQKPVNYLEPPPGKYDNLF